MASKTAAGNFNAPKTRPDCRGWKKLNEADVLVNLFRLTKPQKSYKLKKIRIGEKNAAAPVKNGAGKP